MLSHHLSNFIGTHRGSITSFKCLFYIYVTGIWIAF